MKSITDIYNSIREKFFNKTKIDIQKGTVIDSFILASAEMIEEAYKEIDNNKTPYLYTKLEGKNIDDIGILCGVTRQENENDQNYLYRILNWNRSNKAANKTSIETALMNLNYASHATYSPLSNGCGTATIFIIPKSFDNITKEMAVKEVKEVLKDIISPSSYIEYVIPEMLDVKITLLIKTKNVDKEIVKNNIAEKIVKYVNGIAPMSFLEIGELNKIGVNEEGVEYFNVSVIAIDGEEITETEKLQKINSKFITNKENITYVEVK